jgi:hypothetical protein
VTHGKDCCCDCQCGVCKMEDDNVRLREDLARAVRERDANKLLLDTAEPMRQDAVQCLEMCREQHEQCQSELRDARRIVAKIAAGHVEGWDWDLSEEERTLVAAWAERPNEVRDGIVAEKHHPVHALPARLAHGEIGIQLRYLDQIGLCVVRKEHIRSVIELYRIRVNSLAEELWEAKWHVPELEAGLKSAYEALNRDKTGLAAALDAIRTEICSRRWITEGRGSYAWDDDRYRDEAHEAFIAVLDLVEKGLHASGAIADAGCKAIHTLLPRDDMLGRTPR